MSECCGKCKGEKTMNKEYELTEDLLQMIKPILRKLEGLSLILNQLSAQVGLDKYNLWESIYRQYPELRNVPVDIDEHNKKLIVIETKK